MTPPRSLPDLLYYVYAVVESVMDSGRPADPEHACPMCLERATEAGDHASFCAYRIARTELTPDDLRRLRRFAQSMREEW